MKPTIQCNDENSLTIVLLLSFLIKHNRGCGSLLTKAIAAIYQNIARIANAVQVTLLSLSLSLKSLSKVSQKSLKSLSKVSQKSLKSLY